MIAVITHRPVAQDRAAMGSPGQTGMTPGGTGQLSGLLARSGSGGATGELYLWATGPEATSGIA